MTTYDFDIYQGQTFALSLTLTGVDGSLVDLSGRLISGYLKTYYGDTGKLADLNATIITPSSGVVGLSMSADVTAGLPINYSFYDVKTINTGDGTVTKIFAGKATIIPEVTF